MISTPEVEEELTRAVRNILESRVSEVPLEQRHAEAMKEIATWRSEYEKEGLWKHMHTPGVPDSPRQAALVSAIGQLWGRFVTDPDDIHLPKA